MRQNKKNRPVRSGNWHVVVVGVVILLVGWQISGDKEAIQDDENTERRFCFSIGDV